MLPYRHSIALSQDLYNDDKDAIRIKNHASNPKKEKIMILKHEIIMLLVS